MTECSDFLSVFVKNGQFWSFVGRFRGGMCRDGSDLGGNRDKVMRNCTEDPLQKVSNRAASLQDIYPDIKRLVAVTSGLRYFSGESGIAFTLSAEFFSTQHHSARSKTAVEVNPATNWPRDTE